MWDLATRGGTHVPSIGSAEALAPREVPSPSVQRRGHRRHLSLAWPRKKLALGLWFHQLLDWPALASSATYTPRTGCFWNHPETAKLGGKGWRGTSQGHLINARYYL